jgi:hypothetical protein
VKLIQVGHTNKKTFHIIYNSQIIPTPTTLGYKRIDVIVDTQNSFQAILGETLGSPKTINTNRHNRSHFIIVGDTGVETMSLLI